MIRLFILSAFITATSLSSLAQPELSRYPRGYFIWPVGAKPEIVANFGELRKNHYHMGLDGRTNAKENYPIYAAAAGYVAKVKIEPFGFGRCIYINHPNGLTTVYAHLNDFYPELEEYVKKRQYEAKSWKIFLEDIPPGKFNLKKGDFIAYSGNTGGSQGPHLHFEIRDTRSDKVLNPQLFGMPIPDKVSPDIVRVALYDRNVSTYEQSPRIIPLKKKEGVYTTSPELIEVNTDRISFGITAFDRNGGSGNQNGIYKAVISDNGKQVCRFEMDSISYDETRFLNAHIDFKTKMTGGPYIQHLSILPGNRDMVYAGSATDGVLILRDSSAHDIRIDVYDADGNKSSLRFSVRRKNISSIRKPMPAPVFKPAHVNVFEKEKIRLFMNEGHIYDSFSFNYKEIRIVEKTVHKVHTAHVPVHDYFTLRIKPDFSIVDTGRVIMRRSHGGKDDYKKAFFENGWYKASFREFGDFELLEDKNPPAVTALGFHNGMSSEKVKMLKFTVKDDSEEIRGFSGLLDGKWLLFSNDKGKTFIYERDRTWTEGPHELIITVEDLAGNKTVKKFNFTE